MTNACTNRLSETRNQRGPPLISPLLQYKHFFRKAPTLRSAMSALEQLVAMGFSEERAQKALETQGFNVERAVNVLIATADDAVGDEQQVRRGISDTKKSRFFFKNIPGVE